MPTLEEVQQFLEQNKDDENVKSYLGKLSTPTVDGVKGFLEQNKADEKVQEILKAYAPAGDSGQLTPEALEKLATEKEEIKKWLQSKKDAHFTKGLETWREKNLQKIVDDEIAKRYPPETAEQKQLRELKQKFEESERARQRESLKNKAMAQATTKGLPVELVDFFIGDDEESTMKHLELLETVHSKAVQTAVEQKFKEHGREPKNNLPPNEKQKLNELYERAQKSRRPEDREAYSRYKMELAKKGSI